MLGCGSWATPLGVLLEKYNMLISITYGNKTLPNLIRVLLILLSILCFWIAYIVSVLAAILGIYILSIIFFIRTKVIKIYEDRFVIERESLIRKFDKIDNYYFTDIRRVTFLEGHFKLATILFLFLGSCYKYYTPTGAPDIMEILNKNDDIIEVKRIGNRKEFLNAVNIISERLKLLK